MTPDRDRRERLESIFQAAADLDPAERANFLADRCSGDDELRNEVDSLLRRLDSGTLSFLDHERSSVFNFKGERAGDTIDRYTLVELIGEGGFGSVFRAQQLQPVKREVALKVLKAGMDTRAVLARFDTERQTLARMDHPGIARVLDAGSTPGGRPYFVMDLVRGEPLNRYADEHCLDIDDRLRLFVEVCRAVQHAHQKGVIHRDLKPSNILVEEHEGRPLPRVIDFGIAKATSDDSGERSLATQQGQLIGTPEYMSPEQASGATADIDTRTDVYSLGVLLYELLTGSLPFEPGTLRSKGLAEMQALIRNTDPPRPTQRLSALGSDALDAAARRRATDGRSLRRRIQGDLEWIVLRATEKLPARRYGSPADLAADIERHLAHQPVLAGPPGAGYRLAKFVRRHRVPVVAGAAIVAAITIGLVAASVGFVRAQRERDRAVAEADKAERVSAFLNDLLASVNPDDQGGSTISVQALLDDAVERLRSPALADQPEARARLHETVGKAYTALGRYDHAVAELGLALAIVERQSPGTLRHAELLEACATVHVSRNEHQQAESLYLRALDIRRALPGGADDPGPSYPDSIASVYYFTGRYAEAEAYYRRLIAAAERTPGANANHLANALSGLGSTLEALGRIPEAIEEHQRALAVYRALYPQGSTVIASTLNDLGNTLEAAGLYDRAISAHREALDIRRRLLDANHPETGTTLNNLGLVLIRVGKHEEAESMLREALRIREAALPSPHFATAATRNNLALALARQLKFDDAIPLFESAYREGLRALPANHLFPPVVLGNKGDALAKCGRTSEAEGALQLAYQSLAAVAGESHQRTRIVAGYLAELFAATSRPQEAEYWRARAAPPPPARN